MARAPRTAPSPLWHYTCDHHLLDILKAGRLSPRGSRGLVWLTDLDLPQREGLGLTSLMLDCDRTRNRLRVADTEGVMWWMDYRRHVDPVWRESLEGAPGVMPMHWWVSTSPRVATYEPLR